MDYLYKALQREIGVMEAEAVLLPAVDEPQVAHPPAPVRPAPVAVPAAAVLGKAVPFPVSMERLFVLNSPATGGQHRAILEQYRVLRSRVLEMMRMNGKRTLMVTSAMSGESKTTTSINLALALSQVQGLKVLLVDTDLRKAGIAGVLGINYQVGLQDYLRSPMPLSEMILRLTGSLSFIPSGGVDQNSVELLHSDAMVALIKEVQRHFDLIVFDSPPMFPVADARVIANLVDSVLFCIRAGRTSETTIAEALSLIRSKVIGTARVGAEVRSSGSYYYSGTGAKG